MKHQLTILSFGAGQDSTYILYRLIRDPEYYLEIVHGKLIVVMSDTGDEHDYTYQHVEFVRNLCLEHGIEFYFLTTAQGFHPKTWPSLSAQFLRNSSIMSMMFPRSCTDNVKIKPFYNFLNVYIAGNYYGQQIPNGTRNKTWIKKFVGDYGKIRVILGIAAGEEKRVKESKQAQKQRQLNLFAKPIRKQNLWQQQCIEKVYPMIPEQIDRKMAQDYILATPWPLPPPSNCKFCPFMSKPEILWMYRFTPLDFQRWVQMEQAKIDKYNGLGRNLGVKGEKLLPEILAEAIQEFGNWSDEQLQDYKMSHGHCVSSKF